MMGYAGESYEFRRSTNSQVLPLQQGHRVDRALVDAVLFATLQRIGSVELADRIVWHAL